MIIMLQRTNSLGNTLEMVLQVTNELYKFAFTFGLFLIGAILIGDTLSTSFMQKQLSFGVITLTLIEGFTGN